MDIERTPDDGDLAMLAEAAERYARERVAKLADKLDARDARRVAIGDARELGLLALCAPESAGGLGQDIDALSAVLRAVAREDAGIASLLLVHAGGQRALARAGVWPEGLSAGDLLTWPAFALAGAEPVLRVETDGRVEGSAPLVPFADLAALFLADARGERAQPCLVACSLTGGAVNREEVAAVGLAAAAPFDLRLSNAPARAVFRGSCLSDEPARAWLSLGVAAIALGLLEGSLATALEYARARRQGGRAIVEWDAVRCALADMRRAASVIACGLDGALARRLRGGEAWCGDAVWLALEAADKVCAATTDGVQLLGGNGYTKDYPQERRMRDARQLRAMLGSPLQRRKRACDAWLGA